MTVAQHAPSAREALHSTKSVEWYTPAPIIWAAREMLGSIDLDPASSPEANQVIKGHHFYTEADDGLKQRWAGRVWLNPPYGKVGNVSRQEIWSKRLAAEYTAGNVQAAVLLVNAATDTAWWQALAREYPICLIAGRVKFWQPGGEHDSPTHGSALVYFGPDVYHFGAVCMRLGTPAGNWQGWPGGAK